MNNIPASVKATLWSYDVSQMDIERDKERIITNVLNFGTKDAVDWLRVTYKKNEIADVVAHPKSGEWNKPSLNLWALVYGASPIVRKRF